MEQTDLALAAQRTGKDAHAKALFRAAFELERQAATMVAPRIDAEPTRSILLRSAATLALDCGDYREAEILICEALRGTPPEEIAEELRGLLEQVYFRRHLALRDVVLTETDFQMSIAGKSIGPGMAPIDVFLPRVYDVEKLVYRTAERLSRLPFRKSGPVPVTILNSLEMYASVPRAGSFAVSFRIGQSAQMRIPGTASLGEETIDDLLECLDIFNHGNERRLREIIPQEDYYNNFVALARNVAPDGEDVNFVGFSALRKGEMRTVSLTGVNIASAALPHSVGIAALTSTGEDSAVEIEGFLKEADSRNSKRGIIHVVDMEGSTHTVIVPPEMMGDIVKPLWDSYVVIIGERRKSAIYSADIRPSKLKRFSRP
jgi:hypothetical protein